MNRIISLAAVAALAVSLGAGCSKAETDSVGLDRGTVTDSGDTGLKPVEGAAPLAGDPAHGMQVFSANCASCHGAHGGGGFGPKLIGEKSRKDMTAAVAWIKAPVAPMPKLYPSPLGERDVNDVAAYVESL